MFKGVSIGLQLQVCGVYLFTSSLNFSLGCLKVIFIKWSIICQIIHILPTYFLFYFGRNHIWPNNNSNSKWQLVFHVGTRHLRQREKNTFVEWESYSQCWSCPDSNYLNPYYVTHCPTLSFITNKDYKWIAHFNHKFNKTKIFPIFRINFWTM